MGRCAPETARDPLPERTDVLVVGSGYCGLSAAAELARNGVDVTVVDAEELGAGASTRSGGMVSSGQKLVIGGAIKGVDAARMERLLEDSLSSYEHLKTLIQDQGLDADLAVLGRFFGAHVPRHYDRLRRHGELLARHTGVTVHEIPKVRQHEIPARISTTAASSSTITAASIQPNTTGPCAGSPRATAPGCARMPRC